MAAECLVFRPYRVLVRVPCSPAEAAKAIDRFAGDDLGNIQSATAEPDALELTLLLEEDRLIEDQVADLSTKLVALGLSELQDWDI